MPLTRVAVLQLRSGSEPDANLATIAALTAEAAEAGAHYVLTPEMSVAFVGDRDALLRVALPFKDNPALAFCSDLARQHEIFLHLGSLAIALPDGKFANRSVLFGPQGDIVAQYDKIHLFDADPPHDRPYRESDTYAAGVQAQVTLAAGFKLGMSICFDLRFPGLYAAMAEAGSAVFAVPAAFTVPTGQAHWDVLLRARAIETGSFVIAAAQGGVHENGRATYGHSMIIDPWGKVLAHKNDAEPGILVADLDLGAVEDARRRLPALANRRQFSLSVNKSGL